MEIKLKKVNEKAIIPTYGTIDAAGADLYACIDEEVIIHPGDTKIIKTGIAVAIPKGYAGLIYARSGLALKRNLAPGNKVGVIDADYRGELMVALHNHGNISQKVEVNERIAQLVVTPFLKVEFDETDNLDETDRAEGGFGSTGTK